VEREVLSSSPWDPVPVCVAMVQSCISQGRLRLDIRKCFFPKRVFKPCNRLPREGSVPNAHQCLGGIWTTPLTTCFNLVSPEVVRQLDQLIVVGPFQLKSLLYFYSM